MSEFNEDDFRKSVENNRKKLESHVKNQESKKTNEELINTINTWNGITTPIMIIVGIILGGVYFFLYK